MPSKSYQEVPLTFNKGLTTSSEPSVLNDGQLAAAENLIPEQTGGLRVRGGWRAGTTAGELPAGPWGHRGFGVLTTQSLPSIIQQKESTGASYPISATLDEPVTIGNTLVLLAVSCRGAAADTTLTLTGWTKIVGLSDKPSLADEVHVVYTKPIASSSDNTVSFSPSGGSGSIAAQVILLEIEGITSSGALFAYSDYAAGPVTATTSTTPTTNGIIFACGINSTDTTAVTNSSGYSTLGSARSSGTTNTAWQWFQGSYTSQGTKAVAVDTADHDNVSPLIVTFTATNASVFTTNLVEAISTGHADIDTTGFVDLTLATNAASNTDATSYSTSSVAPALNAIGFVFVVNRKTATTPDLPATITGTNGWNVTWTLVGTKVNGNVRASIYSGILDSTTSGVVTVGFGVGNTQLACTTSIGYATALDTTYLTDLSLNYQFVQTSLLSGTGSSYDLTHSTAVSANTFNIWLVGTPATAGSRLTADSGLTEEAETNASDGATCAVYWDTVGSQTHTITSLDTNDWMAVGVEIWMTQIPQDGYGIYKIPATDIETGDWDLFDTGLATNNSEIVKMTEGSGALVYTGLGLKYIRLYDKTAHTWSDVTDIQPTRSIEYHKNRVFYGGTATNPGRLYFSDLGAPGSIPASNFIDIDADDGTAIEDLISVENLLLVVKSNSLWIVSGSGISSFFVSELSGGGGAAGRSAVSTPYGTIVADQYTVWAVQGGGIDPISRPIQGDYAITGVVSTAYAFDKVYISDSDTGEVWVCNLVSGAWHKETQSDFDEGISMIHSYNEQLFYGTQNSSVCGPVAFRNPGAPERMPDFGPHVTSYHFEGPITALNGPQYKYTPRHIFLQIRRHGGAMPMFITVNAGGQNSVLSHTTEITPTEDVVRQRLDVGFAEGMDWIQITGTQDCDPGTGPYDIERVTLGAEVEVKR